MVAYNNAVNEANAADLELRNAEGEWGGAKDELINLLKDLIGLAALENCLGEGDIVACLELVATAVPWGKFFKLLKTLPKAIKLANRLKNIWDRVSAARKRRDDAQDALRRAREALDRKKPPLACPIPVPRGLSPGVPIRPARFTGTASYVHPPGAGDHVVLVRRAPPDACRLTSTPTSPAFTSKTVYNNGKLRIDVENPVPGKDGAAQIHVQFMGRGADPTKYYYNPSDGTWVSETGTVLSGRIARQIPQSAITKALNLLGL
ncbi:hypothetical protein DPM19_20485 [Actinomadura craniellae]|uniref:Uncharacterized protein n=1 Tax=Actinomadura craniellae TaxID=2231787 RepID=A0A365H2X1_9ACTN|nr:hypothetical protein DPM19_20485 [Actinomadura craniellae]